MGPESGLAPQGSISEALTHSDLPGQGKIPFNPPVARDLIFWDMQLLTATYAVVDVVRLLGLWARVELGKSVERFVQLSFVRRYSEFALSPKFAGYRPVHEQLQSMLYTHAALAILKTINKSDCARESCIRLLGDKSVEHMRHSAFARLLSAFRPESDVSLQETHEAFFVYSELHEGPVELTDSFGDNMKWYLSRCFKPVAGNPDLRAFHLSPESDVDCVSAGFFAARLANHSKIDIWDDWEIHLEYVSGNYSSKHGGFRTSLGQDENNAPNAMTTFFVLDSCDQIRGTSEKLRDRGVEFSEIEGFLNSCRQEDGGYGLIEDDRSSIFGLQFVLRSLRLLDKLSEEGSTVRMSRVKSEESEAISAYIKDELSQTDTTMTAGTESVLGFRGSSWSLEDIRRPYLLAREGGLLYLKAATVPDDDAERALSPETIRGVLRKIGVTDAALEVKDGDSQGLYCAEDAIQIIAEEDHDSYPTYLASLLGGSAEGFQQAVRQVREYASKGIDSLTNSDKEGMIDLCRFIMDVLNEEDHTLSPVTGLPMTKRMMGFE